MVPVFEVCFKAGTTACKAKMPTGVFYISIVEQTCQEIFTCKANTVHVKTQQFATALICEIHKRFSENVVEPHLLVLQMFNPWRAFSLPSWLYVRATAAKKLALKSKIAAVIDAIYRDITQGASQEEVESSRLTQ